VIVWLRREHSRATWMWLRRHHLPGATEGATGLFDPIRKADAAPTWSVFPSPKALLRMAGAVLVEVHDERRSGDRSYLSEVATAGLMTA
jgi:hypothetical protein